MQPQKRKAQPLLLKTPIPNTSRTPVQSPSPPMLRSTKARRADADTTRRQPSVDFDKSQVSEYNGLDENRGSCA